jgi:hypothetical protein
VAEVVKSQRGESGGLSGGDPDRLCQLPGVTGRRARRRRRASEWLAQAGISNVSVRQFALVTGALVALGAVAGLAMFGGLMPALVLAMCIAATPLALD